MTEEYWVCIIGPADRNKFKLPSGNDGPMRNAVKEAFQYVVPDADYNNFHCWSGWGITEEIKEEILHVMTKRKTNMKTEIDEKLTQLLKGKVVKKTYTTAFPDIMIEFEDGTMLSYEFESNLFRRDQENGDEQVLNIHVHDDKGNIFKDEIKRTFHVRNNSGWE